MDTLSAKDVAVTADLGEHSVPRDPRPELHAGARANSRPRRRVGRRKVDGRARHRRNCCRPVLPSRPATCSSTATIWSPCRRRGAALLGRDIAFIPQEPMSALNPVMSIGAQFDEHLARLASATRGCGANARWPCSTRCICKQGADLLGNYPHELSGGMCQRVLIAMAFSGQPSLWSRTSRPPRSTSPSRRASSRSSRRCSAHDGTSVVFITHDLRLAAQICDEIVVLYAGRRSNAARRGGVRRGRRIPIRAACSSPIRR